MFLAAFALTIKNRIHGMLAITTLLMGPGNFAHAELNDVHAKGYIEKHYIEVTKAADGARVGFALCERGTDSTKRACFQLGRKAFYSTKALEKQHKEELRDVKWAWAADVAVIVGAVAAPALIMSGVAASAETLGMTAVFEFANGWVGLVPAVGMGTFIGLPAAGVTEYMLDALNPFEQGRQAETIDSDVVTDKNVVLKGGEIELLKFAKRLETVLGNMD